MQSSTEIISLGSFKKNVQDTNFELNGKKFARAMWFSGLHNTGMILNRKIWTTLKDCNSIFCTYDDYNWDWTMQYVGSKCLKPGFSSLHAVASRVLHIGDCGTHFKGKACDISKRVIDLEESIKKQKDFLFPHDLIFQSTSKIVYKLNKPNGGWPDPRHHQLCKSFAAPSVNNTQHVNLVSFI